MELTLIEKEDVQVGDEIIITSYSNFKYLKVLRLPKKECGRFKCSIFSKQATVGKTIYNNYKFEQDTEKHNTTIYIDLHYRQILLIKKNTQ